MERRKFLGSLSVFIGSLFLSFNIPKKKNIKKVEIYHGFDVDKDGYLWLLQVGIHKGECYVMHSGRTPYKNIPFQLPTHVRTRGYIDLSKYRKLGGK